jgi:hypothetical protein
MGYCGYASTTPVRDGNDRRTLIQIVDPSGYES